LSRICLEFGLCLRISSKPSATSTTRPWTPFIAHRPVALHLGGILLKLHQELGLVVWDYWVENECPILAGAARRYANEAKRSKLAA